MVDDSDTELARLREVATEAGLPSSYQLIVLSESGDEVAIKLPNGTICDDIDKWGVEVKRVAAEWYRRNGSRA